MRYICRRGWFFVVESYFFEVGKFFRFDKIVEEMISFRFVDDDLIVFVSWKKMKRWFLQGYVLFSTHFWVYLWGICVDRELKICNIFHCSLIGLYHWDFPFFVTRIFSTVVLRNERIDRYICMIKKKTFNFINSRNDVTRS